MRDDLRPDDGAASSRAPVRAPAEAEPEREVAVPRTRLIAAQVHAWLDGEGTEAEARRAGGARDVTLWKRIEAALAAPRQRRVPPGFAARLLDSLQ